MKTLNNLLSKYVQHVNNEKPIVCDYVITPFGCHLLKEPVLSTQYECGYCGGKDFYTPYYDPAISNKRTWLCANVNCDVYNKKSLSMATTAQVDVRRALEWPLFCEKNGIGDLYHDVKFERIEQSTPKIDYLFKFANKPCGIIFMQGSAGGGKTYACMGVCELFTRRNPSAIFTTQVKMLSKWLAQEFNNYTQVIETVELLVIDDFGTGEVSAGFMKFFLDIINTRMQWSNRGTIISTNLDNKKFTEYCGEALSDRIKTGQLFEFKEKSRRKQQPL